MTLLAPLTLLFLTICLPAQAYIGPGPGLSMVGSLFTLIGGVVLAVLLVLAYPIRLLIKRIKNKKKP